MQGFAICISQGKIFPAEETYKWYIQIEYSNRIFHLECTSMHISQLHKINRKIASILSQLKICKYFHTLCLFKCTNYPMIRFCAMRMVWLVIQKIAGEYLIFHIQIGLYSFYWAPLHAYNTMKTSIHSDNPDKLQNFEVISDILEKT